MNLIRHGSGVVILLAGLIGGLYLWNLLDGSHPSEGPELTVVFETVEGLEVGAAVRHRGLTVGEVTAISLGPDAKAVEVRCRFQPTARKTLRTRTQFWIVRPRFLGISRGASGLETLVKDPYIAYANPDPLQAGAELPPESRFLGLPVPPDERPTDWQRAMQPGDFRFSVVFLETHGLEASDPVTLRGIPVGIVTSVRLAADGSGVVVDAHVDREYRNFIGGETRFWIDRASVEARWLTGVDVHGLDTLLEGRALAFRTPPAGESGTKTLPAEDGAIFVGFEDRPDLEETQPAPDIAQKNTPTVLSAESALEKALVLVHYSYKTRRWWRTKTHVRQATGVLYRNADGVPCVAVARSLVDARFHSTVAPFGDSILVTLTDGSVHIAEHAWSDGQNADLALLTLDGDVTVEGLTLKFLPSPEGAVNIVGRDSQGKLLRMPAVAQASGSIGGVGVERHGHVATHGGQATGIVSTSRAGSPDAAKTPRLVPFSRIPESLRPASP